MELDQQLKQFQLHLEEGKIPKHKRLKRAQREQTTTSATFSSGGATRNREHSRNDLRLKGAICSLPKAQANEEPRGTNFDTRSSGELTARPNFQLKEELNVSTNHPYRSVKA